MKVSMSMSSVFYITFRGAAAGPDKQEAHLIKCPRKKVSSNMQQNCSTWIIQAFNWTTNQCYKTVDTLLFDGINEEKYYNLGTGG